MKIFPIPTDAIQGTDHGLQAAEAGFDRALELAWVYAHSEVWLWSLAQYSLVWSCRLPYPLQQKPLISVSATKGAVAIILVSADGNLCFWPNVSKPELMISERIAGEVTTVSSGSFQEQFTAAIGCKDGSVFIFNSSDTVRIRKLTPQQRQSGIFRRFTEATAAQPQQPQGAVIDLYLTAYDQMEAAWGLAVLTEHGLCQWKVKLSMEEVQWSLKLEEIAGPAGSSGQLLGLSLPPAVTGLPSAESIAVLSAVQLGKVRTLMVSLVSAHQQQAAQVKARIRLEGVEAAPDTHFCSNATLDAFLLWQPGTPPVIWSSQGGLQQALEADCWAAGAAPDGRYWKLFLPQQGIVALPMRSAQARREGLRPAQLTPATRVKPQQVGQSRQQAQKSAQEAVFSLLEEALAQGQEQPGLLGRIQAAGGLEAALSGSNPIVAYSSGLINALPKHWGGSGTVYEQLQDKQRRHDLLLKILSRAAVLSKLAPADLRAVLENGEKLQAVAALRELENSLQKAQDFVALRGVQELVSHAGAAAQAEASFQNREDSELFYAKPAETIGGFYDSVQAALRGGVSDAALLQTLSHAALAALSAATLKHSWQVQQFPTEVELSRGVKKPEWTADDPVRATLVLLSRSFVRLLPVLQSEAPDSLLAACRTLLQLADSELNAFAAALTALGSSTALENEFAAVRQETLGALLRYGVQWAQAGHEEGKELLHSVQALAEAHRGYEQLFDLAAFQGDPGQLYEQILASAADQSCRFGETTLGAYVFSRMALEGRFGELLCLPEAFNEELQTWLEHQEDSGDILEARWLHAVRTAAFQPAASALQDLAQANSSTAPLEALQRALCLSKLAAIAAHKPALEGTQRHKGKAGEESAVDVQLALLGVQLDLGAQPQGLLPPQELLQSALARPGQAEMAFEVLAAGSHDFREQNRDLWEVALKHLIRDVDWAKLHALGRDMAEDAFLATLQGTAVARVAAACYGDREARMLCAQGKFEDAFGAEEAARILQAEAQHRCPEAESSVALAFSLGVRP